ncbi:hypothetical protein ACJO2E_11010 [Marinobacter sp. M1N3S26]|uniref:hypothetical protein n=1 Tax=Marinobacter sp. M1N3S26 TaxID=3382299 RepID=UPI00387AD941
MTRFLAAVLISLALISPASAEDKEVVEITMIFEEYRQAFSESRFLDAAGYLHPRDVDAFREFALPVLIEARRTSRHKGHPILESFFDTIPLEDTGEASNLEVRAAFDQALTSYLPYILDSINVDNIDNMSVELQGDDSAVVRYELHHNGNEQVVEDTLEKLDGRWHMLMVVRPREHASALREIFDLAP